jgi:uncharacterized membrane protein
MGDNVENDERVVERWTSRSLKLGTWLSGGVMLLGLVMYAVRTNPEAVPRRNPPLGELIHRFVSNPFDPFTLMWTGLVLLMVTPILRVLAAAIGFATEKDNRFVIVSLTVFVLLVCEFLYSLYR